MPDQFVAEVEQLGEPEIVRITSGPFKGRVYERGRSPRQLKRRRDLEA